MNRILVTGASGQSGSYLCEHLLVSDPDCTVDALIRPSGDDRLWRLANVRHNHRMGWVHGDILEGRVATWIANEHYDEVYHLAAMTHVMHSFDAPALAVETNATATIALMDALYRWSRKTKFYFAATSEMFGGMVSPHAANEDFQLGGHSPYAAAKIAAFVAARTYRERGLFVVNGIGFNHESCRRGANFVTRKLGLGVRNFLTTGKPVILGNITARRDWHHAKDTMRGAVLALRHTDPDDYVWASGVDRSVGNLVKEVCDYFGAYQNVIEVHPSEQRPWDVEYLRGDASKAKRVLGWEPQITWTQLIEDICRPEGEL